jgi:hypothetical protein
MVAGDVVILCESMASGYHDGQIGLVVKVESIGLTYNIIWVLMPDDVEVPFWPEELRKIDE